MVRRGTTLKTIIFPDISHSKALGSHCNNFDGITAAIDWVVEEIFENIPSHKRDLLARF